MDYFFRHICLGVCLAGIFVFAAANPAYAVFFATDTIVVYEDGARVSENVILIEYEGIIAMCENGICSFGQQYKENPKLYRLGEPLKNFEQWQEEYLAERAKCLKNKEGEKPGVADGCDSDEPPALIYEEYKKEQAKNAVYSQTVILPELEDRSVHHVDPNMPIGGMLGAYRCFKADIKTAQVEKYECNKNEIGTSYSAQGYVIFISYCPPCPKEAVCAPCLPDFIIISPEKKIIQYPDQMGPEDKVVLTNFQSGFSLGKKYKFRLKIPQTAYVWDKKSTFELVDFEAEK